KLDANAIYIGITSNHKIRWRQHCNACKFAKGSNKRLYNAINKYGVENFEMKVMEEFENRDDANQREIFLIQDFI
ncbi:GIY-YIG nuclease family protein, partial [Bacillus subtilis]|uniref:GIY-YIG nuclease family protein n=1 Tax=Bacillus subtilis TaxID=1423 RepID=UPI003C1E32F0